MIESKYSCNCCLSMFESKYGCNYSLSMFESTYSCNCSLAYLSLSIAATASLACLSLSIADYDQYEPPHLDLYYLSICILFLLLLTVLQIRMVNRGNFGIISHMSPLKHIL